MKEFYRAPKYMIERTDLTDAEKMMLVVIANLSEKTGYCYAKNASLAVMLGWGVDKTRNTLRILKTKGLVKIAIEDNNRREIYILEDVSNDTGGAPNDTGGVRNDTGGVCQMTQGGCVTSHRGGVPNDTPLHNRNNTQQEFNRTESQDARALDGVVEEFDSEGNNLNQTPQVQKEKVAPKRKSFDPPSEIEVQAFFQTTVRPDLAESFYNYYLANGWRVGRNPMKDWKAAAKQWIARDKQFTKPQTNGNRTNAAELAYSLANKIASGELDITKG